MLISRLLRAMAKRDGLPDRSVREYERERDDERDDVCDDDDWRGE